MIVRNGFAFVIAALSVVPAFAEAADLGPYRPAKPRAEYAPPSPEEPLRYYNWSGLYWGLNAGYGWDNSKPHSPEGALGAATLGFNYQTPSGILIGLEGDLGLMDLSADDLSYGPLWGTLRARAGVAFGRTLLYGTGGVALMDVDELRSEDAETGWVIGGGMEQALSSAMSLKVEYLHMDFDPENHAHSSSDNDVEVVRAGLNFRF